MMCWESVPLAGGCWSSRQREEAATSTLPERRDGRPEPAAQPSLRWSPLIKSRKRRAVQAPCHLLSPPASPPSD